MNDLSSCSAQWELLVLCWKFLVKWVWNLSPAITLRQPLNILLQSFMLKKTTFQLKVGNIGDFFFYWSVCFPKSLATAVRGGGKWHGVSLAVTWVWRQELCLSLLILSNLLFIKNIECGDLRPSVQNFISLCYCLNLSVLHWLRCVLLFGLYQKCLGNNNLCTCSKEAIFIDFTVIKNITVCVLTLMVIFIVINR